MFDVISNHVIAAQFRESIAKKHLGSKNTKEEKYARERFYVCVRARVYVIR